MNWINWVIEKMWLTRMISSQIGLISPIIRKSRVNVHLNVSLSYHITSEDFEYRAWVVWTTLRSLCSFCTLKPPVLIQCAWKTATLLIEMPFLCTTEERKSYMNKTPWGWVNYDRIYMIHDWKTFGNPFLLLITISFAFCPAVILLNTSFIMYGGKFSHSVSLHMVQSTIRPARLYHEKTFRQTLCLT